MHQHVRHSNTVVFFTAHCVHIVRVTLQTNNEYPQGHRERVLAPVKKLFGPASKSWPATNPYTESKRLNSQLQSELRSEMVNLCDRQIIIAPRKPTKQQHCWTPGPLPDPGGPVISTGFSEGLHQSYLCRVFTRFWTLSLKMADKSRNQSLYLTCVTNKHTLFAIWLILYIF
jgi:hypothetical protein